MGTVLTLSCAIDSDGSDRRNARELMAKTTDLQRENLRGSPEAIEKRRLARKLNKLLTHGSDQNTQHGRTERRRKRLLKELEEGTRTDPPRLKPIDVLQHAHDLLCMGEPLATLRKVIRIAERPPIDGNEARDLLARLQQAYEFRTEVYEFIGLTPEVLPHVSDNAPKRRGRPRKTPLP
jgi:hypothetical protein